jgi:exodeoxyribonuclease X
MTGSALIFDTELTARVAGQIIEAAWIRLPVVDDLAGPSDAIDLNPAARYFTNEERFCPSHPISFGAMAVHHILPHELAGKRPHTAFELPADVTYLVGHSIDFDWEAAGSPVHVNRICTFAMAQHVFADCDGMSLSALLYFTGGANDVTRQRVRQAHGAMADCWNALALLRAILERKPEITTWSQLWTFSEECRIPLTMPKGRNRGMLLTDCETSELHWYLNQDWIDPYFRKGLERVIDSRHRAPFRVLEDDFDDLDHHDSASPLDMGAQ